MAEDKDRDSIREYDVFRVDGVESNKQTPEKITLAVTIDGVTDNGDDSVPLPVSLPEEDVSWSKDNDITVECLLQDINMNLRIMIRHFEEITLEKFKEDDIEDK